MIIKKLLKNGCFWENLDVLVDIVIYFFEIECLFFFFLKDIQLKKIFIYLKYVYKEMCLYYIYVLCKIIYYYLN